MELCELLHVGRSTVREALRVLQAMGLVEIRHGKGAFVTDRENAVTPEMWFQKYNYKVADIMQVRLPIEQMAVRLAAINMQEKELSHLQEIQDSFRRAVEENNVNQMTLADEYFHGAIIEGTHNPLLISFNANLTEAMREYRLHSFSVPGNPGTPSGRTRTSSPRCGSTTPNSRPPTWSPTSRAPSPICSASFKPPGKPGGFSVSPSAGWAGR